MIFPDVSVIMVCITLMQHIILNVLFIITLLKTSSLHIPISIHRDLLLNLLCFTVSPTKGRLYSPLVGRKCTEQARVGLLFFLGEGCQDSLISVLLSTSANKPLGGSGAFTATPSKVHSFFVKKITYTITISSTSGLSECLSLI